MLPSCLAFEKIVVCSTECYINERDNSFIHFNPSWNERRFLTTQAMISKSDQTRDLLLYCFSSSKFFVKKMYAKFREIFES